MGPLSLGFDNLKLGQNPAATGATEAPSFLLWNATDYLLISGTDRFQISL